MARTRRDSKLDNRSARLKLPRGKWHQSTLEPGLALRYRRPATGPGVWYARIHGSKTDPRLGLADDYDEVGEASVLDWKQAQAAARKLAARGPVTPYTVAEACDDYMKWYREHRKAIDATESTIRAHIHPGLEGRAATAEQLVFAGRPIASLTSTELKAWRDKLAKAKARRRTRIGKVQQHKKDRDTDEGREEAKRARRATANRILAVLKAILNKAFEDEKVTDDTAWRRVRPFENVDVPRIRFLTEAESLRLVNASGAEFRPLVRAGLLTGARYGELVRMTVGAFNPNTAQVFIAPSKSGKSRYVPLNQAGLELFKSLATGRKADAPMFPRGAGSWGKNHQQRPMIEACKEAKIAPPLRFHECRHTYASTLAQAGADLLTISKLLGHADTRITSRHYAHLCDRTLANAVNNLLPDFGSVEPSNVAALR